MRRPSIPLLLDDLAQQGLAVGLECDGLTRMLHSRLISAHRPHLVLAGVVTALSSQSPPHRWIVLADGTHVDYAVRRWLGDEPTIPHGVFVPAAYPMVTYTGQPIRMEVLAEPLIQALLMPFPADLLRSLPAPPAADDP